jgi:hypothetical protein
MPANTSKPRAELASRGAVEIQKGPMFEQPVLADG